MDVRRAPRRTFARIRSGLTTIAARGCGGRRGNTGDYSS